MLPEPILTQIRDFIRNSNPSMEDVAEFSYNIADEFSKELVKNVNEQRIVTDGIIANKNAEIEALKNQIKP